MKILFKLASRSRPQKFFSCLENIIQMIDDRSSTEILVSIDSDDNLMQSKETQDQLMRFYNDNKLQGVLLVLGSVESKNKVHAINRDMEYVGIDFIDIIINTSDDMVFTRRGFDNIIRSDIIKHFHDLDGFLHYNDGNQKSNVCTMSIMGRKYYERFNYIYHPDYKSVWCDVEQTEVAYMLGKYRYMGDDNILFRHLHPAWGLAEYDDQYRKSDDLNVWGHDLKTLLERRARNYDLKADEIVNPFLYSPDKAEAWKRDLNGARINQGMEAIKF